MSDIDLNSVLSTKDQQAIEKLMRETEADESLVAELYRVERMQLEKVASIHTYVPLLASRAVKLKLPEVMRQRESESADDQWLCL